MDNETLLKKRFLELAQKAYKQNTYIYTNFLSINELNTFYNISNEINFIGYSTFGGNEQCERQIIEFGSINDFGYEGTLPICLIQVTPLIKKFSDTFSHRDFLGAILNLGIDRSVTGDIIIKNNYGYVYCLDKIADYIIDNLTKVKHTHVKCSIVDNNITETSPTLEDVSVIVASLRADATISVLLKTSRSQSLNLFQDKKIYINGLLCENNSQLLKPNDVLVIRGHGKYIFIDSGNETRKGRIYVNLKKYV